MRIAVGGLLVVGALVGVGGVLVQEELLPLPDGVAMVLGARTPKALSLATAPKETPVARAANNPVNEVALTRQTTGRAPEASSPPLAPPAAGVQPSPPSTPSPRCDNPNALGVSRVVQIDTTGGPGFGFEHFKTHDFLRPTEVVLTFDDGPWPGRTPVVLAALGAECVKATFFPIGKHAMYHPEILKQVAEQGHTIGSHTWSHQDLSKLTLDRAKDEIEMGASAVHIALGTAPAAPFFRFPALRHPPEAVAYLGQRNIGIFSTDMDSFDFKIRKPEQVVNSVMTKLDKAGKGIVLIHDFQPATPVALSELLKQLKAKGYKIVHMTPKASLTTLEAYDAQVMKELGGPGMTGASARPTSDVVQTISE